MIMAARATFQKSFNIRVAHDEAAGKFFISTMDGDIVLHYESVEDKLWRFVRTEVPPRIGQPQLLNRIIEYAFEVARKSNRHIEPACPTVQSFLARNSFYQSLIA